MSYDLTAFQVNHFSSNYADRGQWSTQLDNYRLWMSPTGTNPAPRISTVTGTGGIWHSSRQTWNSNNINTYASFVSGFGTTAQPFNTGEQFNATGDHVQVHFTDGVGTYRMNFNVADQFRGNLLSLENLTVPVPTAQGGIGVSKVNGWVANNQELVSGNIAIRIPGTGNRGMQFRHVTSAFDLRGQNEANYAGTIQTRSISKTSSLTFQAFNPTGQEYIFVTFGSAEIADFLDVTNNIKYRITCVYFSNNGGVSTNYFNITIERFT